jgi:fructuronate reductase/mannitol 2-dehydrogenase
LLPLTELTLPSLSRRVSVPTYDRRHLIPSIVHIGVGAFHRAHQAVYLDDVASISNEWGEVGVSLRSARMRPQLRSQDYLFTVLERGDEAERARVVGVLRGYHFAPDQPATVINRVADPRTRMVSLTITGDGYNLDAAGRFQSDHQSVLHDLQNPHNPITWFGYVTTALARRRELGLPGVTVLSCDNVPANGAAARRALLGFAHLHDEALAAWIERNVSFPSSMVDRITPQPDSTVSDLLAGTYGVFDRAPVQAEDFTQWIIEDTFCEGRPPFEDVGVQMVTDVSPYKLVKMRLLNGTHSAMAYLGYLAGYRTTADMVAEPKMRTFLESMMREEIAPVLPSPPGMDVAEYIETVLGRLANRNVTDTLVRLCGRGSTKVPSYVLPTLLEARRQNLPTPRLTLAVAAWLRYLRGTDLHGARISITDARLEELRPLAERCVKDPSALLGMRSIMGETWEDAGLLRQIHAALAEIDTGLPAALERRVDRRRSAVELSRPSRSGRALRRDLIA